METLLSLTGVIGALLCVGMYAAVSFGKISADRPLFYIVNGMGALLVLAGAAHNFDLGDLGTIGQEAIWAVLSLIGAARAWIKGPGAATATQAFAKFRALCARVADAAASTGIVWG